MALTGSESYINIEEMTTYVATHYLSTDPLRVQWEALSTEDQEVLLRNSFEYINGLPYTGRPSTREQKVPFPRLGFTPDDMQTVKNAQAEQTMSMSDTVAAQEVGTRLRLRRAGVEQYRIGDLSEKFQKGSIGGHGDLFGLSEKAYGYLAKWLRGGYRVCTSIKKHDGVLRKYVL